MATLTGCPQLQGSQLTWTHEACSGTSPDYRAVQELAYINHSGVPVESIYVLMTAFPLILMMHQSCGASPLSEKRPLQCALWDACIVGLPLTFHFSAHLEQPLMCLFLAASILELRRCSKGGLAWEASFTLDGNRLRFVSEYRALVMMSTCVAILAVDFSSVFSRAQAKTEEFGYSLMDVGTGSIIFSSGLVCRPRQSGEGLRRVMKLWPVLLIGFVRAALMWGIDYHVPAGEYGIHWNFFFTIAVVSLVSTTTDFSAEASAASAALVLGAYQFYLSWLGGADFILHAERVGLFSANREGIFSSAGYLGLHWLGVATGSTVRGSALRCVLQLFLVAGLGYLTNRLLSHASLEASRRMCNLPYVLFILSLNCWVLALLACVDLLAGRPRTPMSPSLAGVQDSMLPVFLLANLLTGAVNVAFQPLMVPFWPAIAVMWIYSLLWSVPAALLRLKKTKLKFW